MVRFRNMYGNCHPGTCHLGCYQMLLAAAASVTDCHTSLSWTQHAARRQHVSHDHWGGYCMESPHSLAFNSESLHGNDFLIVVLPFSTNPSDLGLSQSICGAGWSVWRFFSNCFPRSSIKFQGHTGQNITDFDPNWAFSDYRPVLSNPSDLPLPACLYLRCCKYLYTLDHTMC